MPTVLVAIDDPAGGDAVLDAAGEYATRMGARIVALTVVPVVPAAYVASPTDEAMARAGELAGLVAERMRRRGAPSVESAGGVGEPGPAICATADRVGADLIVMGSHGHGRLAGAVLGSAAQHVTARAPCPVLVVR
jgi:nucleotide-binding universal stress UspA family protein